MTAPKAKRVPVERSAHGYRWTDEYDWLRAPNWQDCVDDPEQLPADIKAHLNAENAWFDTCMADTQPLQARLLAEMRARIPADDDSLPDEDGDWCYVQRYRGEQEHPCVWRYPRHEDAAGQRAQTQLLIDFNKEAEGQSYFEPGDVEYSPDHTHLAWSRDISGAERYVVSIRHIHSGEDLYQIHDVESVVWGDASHLFYTRVDADYRASEVYRHTLGSDPQTDVCVYQEKDSRFFCSVWVSLSREYVFIGCDMNDQNEVWFIPTLAIESTPVLVEPRTEGLEYSLEHQLDRFLILTNADGAADYKIMETPCSHPARANWVDWLASVPGRMVLDVYAYNHWVMWLERENALPKICYRRCDEERIHSLTFEQEAYALSLEPLLECDNNAFRYSYESPSTPARTYRFDMSSATQVLLREELIPSGHNPSDYVVRRRQARSSDGAWVPVTLVHHVSTSLDGQAPAWVSVYGAYGASTPATFSAANLSLMDRGFVIVLAHVRGGQEKGRAWYEAARKAGKPKSIDDVLAVGEYLVEQQYACRGRLLLSGASAGGLIVGAALNRHSDLWAGAVADVPFVDALNTLLDESLPLTPGEWSQWGNPIEDEAAFKAIRSYSPYDNVQACSYPHLLVTAGVSDPRVTYWEPAKWVALLRQLRSNDNLLLLKTNMHSGHFGETGRFASLADTALEQAFALKVVGLACGN